MYNWRNNAKSVVLENVPSQTVFPIDSVSHHMTPIIFNVPSVPGFVVDTRNLELIFDFKVLKQNADGLSWEPLEQADLVCPLNFFGAAVFQNASIAISGQQVESCPEYYRKAYLTAQLFKSQREKQALNSALLCEDNPFFGDSILTGDSQNNPSFLRSQNIKSGAVQTIITPIFLDSLQHNFYLPNVSFDIKMYMARAEQCLLHKKPAGEKDLLKLKVSISYAALRVPRYQLKTSIPRTVTCDYSVCKALTFTSPAGLASFNRSLTMAQLPSKIVIATMPEDTYFGDIQHSGNQFYPNAVNNVRVTANCRHLPLESGISVDPEAKNYTEAYRALFTQIHSDSPNFTVDSMDNGNVLFAFGTGSQVEKPGSLNIFVSFKQAPVKNLIVLIFCWYQAKFHIDKHGTFSSTPEL